MFSLKQRQPPSLQRLPTSSRTSDHRLLARGRRGQPRPLLLRLGLLLELNLLDDLLNLCERQVLRFPRKLMQREGSASVKGRLRTGERRFSKEHGVRGKLEERKTKRTLSFPNPSITVISTFLAPVWTTSSSDFTVSLIVSSRVMSSRWFFSRNSRIVFDDRPTAFACFTQTKSGVEGKCQ